MIRSTLKYCKVIVCLAAFMLTSVCGYSQFYRHAYFHPYAIDRGLMTMDAIARQAIFADLVLHDFSNDAICAHPINRSAAAKLCAQEIAINTAAPLTYDLLSLTDINDRDLYGVGIALGCAQLALSAAAINKAVKASKETVETQPADTEPTPDEVQLQEQRRKENKALTTLVIVEAAAMTLDAIFGNYGGGYRGYHPHYHHYRRHYHPYY